MATNNSPEKVVGLMTNPNKNIIRTEIINQVRDVWALDRRTLQDNSNFRALTLPGTNFVFEEMLTATASYSGWKVAFDCFECSRPRFELARKIVPVNCNFHLDKFEEATEQYDLVWADYCSTLHASQITSAINNASRSGRQCLLYLSFCMGRVDYRKLGQRIGSPGCTPKRVVERAVERRLTQKNIPWARVYSVHYAGGGNGKSPMLTVGYILYPIKYHQLPHTIDAERIHGAGRRVVALPRVKKDPKVYVVAGELSRRILRLLRVNLTRSGHTLGYVFKHKAWRTRFIQQCVERYGCPWQRPVGVLNGMAKMCEAA